jgi:hypothetical protein
MLHHLKEKGLSSSLRLPHSCFLRVSMSIRDGFFRPPIRWRTRNPHSQVVTRIWGRFG